MPTTGTKILTGSYQQCQSSIVWHTIHCFPDTPKRTLEVFRSFMFCPAQQKKNFVRARGVLPIHLFASGDCRKHERHTARSMRPLSGFGSGHTAFIAQPNNGCHADRGRCKPFANGLGILDFFKPENSPQSTNQNL